jgi:hypothetical protein
VTLFLAASDWRPALSSDFGPVFQATSRHRQTCLASFSWVEKELRLQPGYLPGHPCVLFPCARGRCGGNYATRSTAATSRLLSTDAYHSGFARLCTCKVADTLCFDFARTLQPLGMQSKFARAKLSKPTKDCKEFAPAK